MQDDPGQGDRSEHQGPEEEAVKEHPYFDVRGFLKDIWQYIMERT